MRRRFGDRKDGKRIRKGDPFFKIIPYIMKDRNDAQVFFDDRIYLENSEKMSRELRKQGYKVGFLHFVLAAMVRTMSQKPKINRFVAGRKLYARNDISFSIAIKKDMNEETPETTIKISFDGTETIYEVMERLNDEINKNKNLDTENDTDKAAKIITYAPGFLIRFVMWMFNALDNKGWLPKFLTDLSPFHSSVFVTDLGSLGIKSVYHHIYNFGTNTIFIGFGIKDKEQKFDRHGNFKNKKVMDLKVVVDERVVDGYYFAQAIKLFKKTIENPEVLLTPPDEVIIDNDI
ncbi:hypothetical protein CI105_02900 [Candidatus Izimaplasma bacterium ZiA1]|uniref:2-oxo acid dehydrogenase subunit E2 n=1 Tax=Candidatus Izimoplasma sp. ZiA1 TaxID=2024899 RepID=UPI000BAA87A8|nr:hypothetical protein CI105_02900 [Candidatus Izimaplasma bacterium ZiA1]